MLRTSGRVRCSNCGGTSAWWRLRYATDEHGNAIIYAYCSECRCMLTFDITAAQINRLRREGAVTDD